MSTTINDRHIQYTASGGQTVFPYDFKIEAEGDLKVVRVRAGAETQLTGGGTHYSVDGVGVAGGGNVTLASGALAGDVLTIYGDEPEVRETDYQTTGDFAAASVDREGDEQIRLIQQLRRDIDRTPHQWPLAAASSPVAIPATASQRALKVLGFDSSGLPALVSSTAVTSTSVTSDGGTSAVSLATFIAGFCRPEAWGAAGDGVTDDAAALAAAATYAGSYNAPMTLDPRRTYGFVGQLICEASIDGNGATLRPLTDWDGGAGQNVATLYNNGASDLHWRNFTVNTQGRGNGLFLYQGSRIRLENVATVDCRGLGFSMRLVDDLLISGCRVQTVKFYDQATPGGTYNTASDGFYVSGCANVMLRGCQATDLQAIGIVVEGEGAVPSTDVTISDCHVWNTNNPGFTKNGSRYAAGLWAENFERRLSVNNFHCWDLANNDTQIPWTDATPYVVGDYCQSANKIYRCTAGGTSGLPAPSHTSGAVADGGGVEWTFVQTSVTNGIVISPSNTVPTAVQIQQCSVRGVPEGETVQTMKALSLTAGALVTGRLAFKVSDVSISNCKGQILNVSAVGSTVDAVELDHIAFDGCELAGASSGLIFVQGAGTIRKLSIRNPIRDGAIAPGTDPDFGDLTINGPTITDLELEGLVDWHPILYGGPDEHQRMSIRRSSLTFGTTVGTHSICQALETQLDQVIFSPWVPTGGAYVGSHIDNTPYALGDVVHHLGRYYVCSSAGTSATGPATPPTGTGATIADGTVVWDYLHNDLIFHSQPEAGGARVTVVGRDVTLHGAIAIEPDGSMHHLLQGFRLLTGGLVRYKPQLLNAAYEAVLDIRGGRAEGYDAEFGALRTNYYSTGEAGVRRIFLDGVQFGLDEIGGSATAITSNGGSINPEDLCTNACRSYGTLIGSITPVTNDDHNDYTIT